VEKCSSAGQVTDDNMAQAIGILQNNGYKNTHTKVILSTAAAVMRTFLSDMFVLTLPVLLNSTVMV
jgi:hypothetical protein